MSIEAIEDGLWRLEAPITDDDVRKLHAGDRVRVFGKVLTGRDAAHKKMTELLDAGKPLPFDIAGQVMYYVGPTPPRPGRVIGSAGPTTSGRVDRYLDRLSELGLKITIGKGGRTAAVRGVFAKHTCAYLAALGGGGALAAQRIRSERVVAWEELGTEAVRELEFEDFPAWVINDCYGADHYEKVSGVWRRAELLPEGYGA